MKRSSALRPLRRIVLVAFCLGAIITLAAVSRAKVETTAGGAHQRLLIPIGRKALSIPVYSGTGDHVFMPGHLDGPVVRRTGPDTWTSTWYCQDEVHHRAGAGHLLEIGCAVTRRAFALGDVAVPAAIAPMPSRLVVLSDLEGNSAFMEAALRKLGVVGAAGGWQFGQGQLVVLGDSVDRGKDVFAVLWRLRELAGQAQAAGGAVHVLLGNHEQYVLHGNLTRADPEHRYALKAMGGYSSAFDADTVIGAWLREQPVVLQLGRVLFTHGGISRSVVESKLGVAELNEAMRAYWRNGDGRSQGLAPSRLEAVLGRTGVTQYRGYFGELDGHYPAATQADIDAILAHFNVEQIVVGHTLVDRVKPLHGGRIMAVDVNDDEARPEVLVYNHGVPSVVDIGLPRHLDNEQKTERRSIRLLDKADRQMLIAMVREFWTLSRLPDPR
jgi:hypothetical protein